MEFSINLKCQAHQNIVEYVYLEETCVFLCQFCRNENKDYQMKALYIEDFMNDGQLNNQYSALEKEYNIMTEIQNKENTKIDKYFGRFFKIFFDESEQTKQYLKNKYVNVYKDSANKMQLIRNNYNNIQMQVQQKQKRNSSFFYSPKIEVLDSEAKMNSFIQKNKDRVEMMKLMGNMKQQIKQRLGGSESYKPNDEAIQEFEYQFKQIIGMITDSTPKRTSLRNSMSSCHSGGIEQGQQEQGQQMAFINENNDIQINNQKVIQTLQKLGKLPYINQQILDKMNLQVIGPVYLNNYIYFGQFDKNRKQKVGRGKLVNCETGSLYEGYFRDDVPFGIGRVIYQNGDYYEGFTQNLKAEGKGLFVSTIDNYVYNGEFKNGMKDGIGEEKRANGVLIKGNFKQGSLDDNMTILIQYADGSYYQGQHLKGIIDGEGNIVYKNGEQYNGHFQQGIKQGKGAYQFKDGSRYEGTFLNDAPHGTGVFVYADGVVYQGEFINGVQHGRGVERVADKQRVGEWNNGQFIRWLS